VDDHLMRNSMHRIHWGQEILDHVDPGIDVGAVRKIQDGAERELKHVWALTDGKRASHGG